MSLCSNFRRLAAALALVVPTLLTLPAAHAHSVAQSSASGDSFAYDVLAQDGTVSFFGGSTISMDGFSGQILNVTLSSLAATYGTVSFSDSAIVYTLNENQYYSWPAPLDLPLFTVTTATSSLGTLYWTLNESTGAQTGTIAPFTGSSSNAAASDPSASSTTSSPSSMAQSNSYASSIVATPEPSALILLGTGCVAAAGLLRRRLV